MQKLYASQLEARALFLLELERLAGDITLRYFRNLPTTDRVGKENPRYFDPVTLADRDTEQLLSESIKAAFPEDGLLGEEGESKSPINDWRWIIDPIDGTKGYVSGLPLWTSLIALEYRGSPVFGLISQPFMNEFWLGNRYSCHYFRFDQSEPAKVSGCKQLSEARLATTSPIYFSPGENAAFEQLRAASLLSRYGTDGYAYALLAIGQVDLVVEAGLSYWDLAAHIPVVEGAGGVIADWKGHRFDGQNLSKYLQKEEEFRVVAAASREILDQCLPTLRRAL